MPNVLINGRIRDQDEINLADKTFSSIIPDRKMNDEEARAKRLEMLDDLQSVGVTPEFFSSVHVATSAGDVVKWIKNYFRLRQNVIIFGSKGFGKTQMVQQAADSLGLDLITESTATKLPEDYGGIPLAKYAPIPTNVLAAKIREELRQKKLDYLVEQELTKQLENSYVTNPRLLRMELARDLAPKVQVTDAEIQQELSTYSEDDARKLRAIQEMTAPDWVYQIQDNWLLNHRATVLFLDELNQARPDVQNALFDFVQHRRFGNKEQYRLADAVIFAGAGNFARENASINPIPAPLLDRFKNIILYEGDWESSVQWNKDSYLSLATKYPHLAELLADSTISTDAWKAAFSTPRSMEGALTLWAQLEQFSKEGNTEALAEYDDLDSVGLSERLTNSLTNAVKNFLKVIGAPAGTGGSTKSPSNSATNAKNMRIIADSWFKFMSGNSIKFPDGTSMTLKNNTPIDFYRELSRRWPGSIDRELLSQVHGPDGKSMLDELKAAGISNSDLPVK